MGGAGAAARARRWACSGPLIARSCCCAAPAAAAPQLVKVGDFDGPTYATGAPGDASRVFVAEKPGRVRLVRDGAVLAQPFLDLSATTLSSDEERGLLSAAFAPDYATSGRFYVYLTARPGGRDPGLGVHALGGEPGRRRPGERAAAAGDPAHRRRQPQRRAAAVRARRQAVARDRRRRRRQRPVRALAGPGVAAGQADPARPGRARAGGRRARAAQPVALLVRSRERAARDRRRRPGRVRGDRRRARRRTTAGRASRARRGGRRRPRPATAGPRRRC